MSDTIPPPPPEEPRAETSPTPPMGEGAPIQPAPPPARSKLPRIVGLVVVLAILAVLAIVALKPKDESASGNGVYTDNGVTLRYPDGWIHGPTQFAAQRGTSLWSETFAPGSGPDSVIVTQYRLQNDISGVPVAEAEQQLTQLARGLAQEAGGDLTSEAAPAQVGALNGYRITFTASVNGTPLNVELTMLFRGTDQYNINCQYSDAKASEITAGCAQVKDTFALTGESPSP